MSEKKSPFLDKRKFEYFINYRQSLDEFYRTEQHFFQYIMEECRTIVDVGCGAAGMYKSLKEKFGGFKYTGIEYDPELLRVAGERYPEAEFICGDFLSADFPSNAYDLSMAFGVVYEHPSYKDIIRKMVGMSRKYILIDVRLRYDGTTVVDVDRSYFFYHGSGKRVDYIVFNIYEFLNFLNNEELNLKKISAIGTRSSSISSAFLPFPRKNLVAAVFLLEKHDDGYTPVRIGAEDNCAERPWCVLDLKLPDFDQSCI